MPRQRLNILHITLEFSTWEHASHFPYSGNFAFEEGFAAANADYLTIPVLYETSSDSVSWLSRAREICVGKTFDQVWLEVVHTQYDDLFLEWITSVAPVRVGIMWESCEYQPSELANPQGLQRRQTNIARNLPILTHLIAVDEKDVLHFNNEGKVQAKWLWDGGIIPRRFISDENSPPPTSHALFYGALYGERKQWLEHPCLQGKLVRPPLSPEYGTPLPSLFNKLIASGNSLAATEKFDESLFEEYIDSLRMIRQKSFRLWLEGLKKGVAVVNLPQLGKAYASRVAEGMAAGRPVITWRIPGRPRTEELFEDGREILLYDPTDPEDLAECIDRILRDESLARNIARNATRKLRSNHTIEELVRQTLAWTETGKNITTANSSATAGIASSATSSLEELRKGGLLSDEAPLRLHLGCGEQHIDGYVNIDYPPSEHNVMNVAADAFADITTLDFPPCSVDEIRLHHVFEHFNRVQALGLLIKWHSWLKPNGKLIIETPDLEGSARTLLSNATHKTKMGVVRHLAGDQSAAWAYHLDHWYPERFKQTLSILGFTTIETISTSWDREPYLSNVTVTATKAEDIPLSRQLEAAEQILWNSTVADAEKPTFEVWKQQLHALFETAEPPPSPSAVLLPLAQKTLKIKDERPLAEIHDFNQQERDRWVAAKAAGILPGSRVLDVGAGTCPYRRLFSHCDYRSHDFGKYEGEKLGGTNEYGDIDFESDITSIPVPDESFDVVLCTEVLEHVPEPILALKEMARILKPGGRLLITAPLGAGLHQLPFHFYGGYTPQWYRHFCPLFGLNVEEVTPNGGFFKLLAQECARVAWTFPQHQHLHGSNAAEIHHLFSELLPRYLFDLDEKCRIDQFTVGYHVDAVKTIPTDKSNLTSEKMSPKNLSCNSAIIFSKDRPLQLDGTLNSLQLHCSDFDQLEVHVLYLASEPLYQQGYDTLIGEYANRKNVRFHPERDFKADLISLLEKSKHVLFLVDDNIFVRPFSFQQAVKILDRHQDAIGFSLRLGRNTTYCYPLDAHQRVPNFQQVDEVTLKYRWPDEQHDFSYPLEVSSSIFRTKDILPILLRIFFRNPNTLEACMDAAKSSFVNSHPFLLCPPLSITFCNPVNMVQNVIDTNRSGVSDDLSPPALTKKFLCGKRIDVKKYVGFIPNGCHQEVPFHFTDAEKPPLVSVIIPCYNQAHFLPEAVESVVQQTFTDWELIIVNDGSPDNTSEVAKQLIKHHKGKRIHLLDQQNQGLSQSRNNGIARSRGKYILPLDSDDLIHPVMLEKTVSMLESHPEYSFAYTDQIYFGAEEKRINCLDYDFKTLLTMNYFAYCSLFRRSAWEEVGGYKTNMKWGYEDWEFWISCGEKGLYGIRIPEPLFFYRVKQESMLTTARKHDDDLKAQIVLNHPALYSSETIQWAQQKLGIKNSRSGFRVIAIISAHNEGDVIYHVIGDLIHQGVEVYLINHCSTDNTVAEASKWLGKGLIHIENFPQDAGYPEANEHQYIWSQILKRKEELAAQLDADWFIHSDADEFRESPWPGLTLKEAIRVVDAKGYSAIDFELFNFRPTNNNFVPGTDVRDALTFYEGGDIFDALQIKAWKKSASPVSIMENGGHDISFDGRKIYPIKFLLRHYPIRSQQHGLKKVFAERKNRFNNMERNAGWHIQYDSVVSEHHNFIRNPDELTLYDGNAVRLRLLSNEAIALAKSFRAPPGSSHSVTIQPDGVSSESIHDEACSLKSEGRFVEALDVLSKILTQGDRSVLVDAGDCLAALEKHDDAIALYEEALAAAPADARAHVGIGVVRLLTGKLSEASGAFSRALNVEPANPKALCGLGLVRNAQERPGEAFDLFRKALDADPENLTALHELVKLAYALDRFREAAGHLETYLMYHPGDTDMLFSYAGILYMANEPAKAHDAVERLLALSPGYEGAQELLEKIGTRDSGLGTRDSGLETRDSGLGTRDSGPATWLKRMRGS